MLSPSAGVNGHALVSIGDEQIVEGSSETRQNLVLTAGALGDLTVLEDGTSFWTQSHNDLGVLLDSLLTALGDNPAITDRLIQQIIAIVLPGLLGANGLPIVPLAVVLVDPTSIGLVAPDGASLTHDLGTNTLVSNLPLTFVEVGGNLELIVIANPVGNYELSLADVPAHARAGVVYFGRQGAQHDTFTDALRQDAVDDIRRGRFQSQRPICGRDWGSIRRAIGGRVRGSTDRAAVHFDFPGDSTDAVRCREPQPAVERGESFGDVLFRQRPTGDVRQRRFRDTDCAASR